MPRPIFVLLLCWFAIISGCAGPLPLQDMIVLDVPIEKTTGTISMGETIATHYICPCTEVYRAEQAIEIVGYRTVLRDSLWEAKYRNTVTGDLYLVNNRYHRSLALVLRDGAINSSAAVVQIRGRRRSRSWKLADSADAAAMRFVDYRLTGPTWRLQYIGTEGSNSSVIRLAIEEYGRGNINERIGQVEYRHDMVNGNEFVIRGMRIRIDDVTGDGLLTFTILNMPNEKRTKVE